MKKDEKINMLNKVFHEDGLKMEFYNMVKKGYLPSEDAVKERSLNFFQNCEK